MIKKIDIWIRKWIITFYRNKLNSNVLSCFFFMITLDILLCPFMIVVHLIGMRLLILLFGIPFFYSVIYFFNIIIYDISSIRFFNKKVKYLKENKRRVKDFLKLLTVGHRNLTVERAFLNNEILIKLMPLIEKPKTKSLIENLIEYYNKRLNYLSNKYYFYSKYRKKFFLSGHPEVDEEKIKYLTHLYHKARREIRESYKMVELSAINQYGRE